MAFLAHFDLELTKWKDCFLNGNLVEDVFMKQLTSFEVTGKAIS